MKKQSHPSLIYRDPRALAGLPWDVPLLVALSGGADSVALLSLLKDCPPVSAVHVHHGIRGDEADRDAAFCEELARNLGVPFTLLSVNAPEAVEKTGQSLETAARNLRYGAISDFMKEQGIPLLVTAHHADDQLETVLQHLLRGSGTRGLSGIPACRPLGEGLLVARPLLHVTKEELLAYLKEKNLSFVTDSTNSDTSYQRNFLRAKVLPLLKELQPAAPLLAARLAASLAEDEQYFDEKAAEFLRKEGGRLPVPALQALPKPILVRVLRRMLPEAPTALHIDAICRLLGNGKKNAMLSLPPKTVLRIENGCLTVTPPQKKHPAFEVTLTTPVTVHENPRFKIVWGDEEENTKQTNRNLYKYTTNLSLDASIMEGGLVARSRRAGDVIFAGGMHKAVRRLSALSHLPPDARARMPLLAKGDDIVAVPFFGASDKAKKGPTVTVTVYFD